MKNFIKKYGHAWILSYGLIYIAWFSYLEKTVTTQYHVMHTALDDYIPFNEYFIIPYYLWFAYVAFSILYFLFTSKQDYYKLCAFLFTGMTISLFICTIYPNGTLLRPVLDPDKNIFTKMVANLYAIDTCTNVFPSIHVFNSIGVHIGIMHSDRLRKHSWIRIGSFVLMLSICLSTVVLKQHSVVDVIGAVMMATVLYPLVYTPEESYSYRHRVKKELQSES